jgi:hypothetical protein
MSKRPRRNHAPAFKANVALGAMADPERIGDGYKGQGYPRRNGTRTSQSQVASRGNRRSCYSPGGHGDACGETNAPSHPS